MSGWRTTKAVMDLRDEIIEKLNAASPGTREHAWHWICWEMSVEKELKQSSCHSVLDDEAIEWLRSNPARYERHKEIKMRLIESLEKQLMCAKSDMIKLEKPTRTEGSDA